MKYNITVRVAAEDKVIDIPWKDIEKDFDEFIDKGADPLTRKMNRIAFRIVTSRIHCVFLDRYKNSLIQ